MLSHANEFGRTKIGTVPRGPRSRSYPPTRARASQSLLWSGHGSHMEHEARGWVSLSKLQTGLCEAARMMQMATPVDGRPTTRALKVGRPGDKEITTAWQ